MRLKVLITFIFCAHNACLVFSQIPNNIESQQRYDYQNFVEDSIKSMNTYKNLKSMSEQDRAFINEFKEFLRYPTLLDYFLQEASDKCFQDLMYVFESLKLNSWAANMLDSYGKPESGILLGNVKWLGEYDECLSIYAPPKANTSVGDFHGQYCTLKVPLQTESMEIPLSLGVCLPDSCDPSTFMPINLNFSNPFSNFTGGIEEILLNTTLTCQHLKPLSAGGLAVICLISLFALLALIGSSITVYEHYIKVHVDEDVDPLIKGDVENLPNNGSTNAPTTDNNQQKTLPVWLEKAKTFFNCFCFFTNGEKIINTSSSEGQLPCLHGIRFLSMSWVILCHTYFATIINVIRNEVEIYDVIVNNWMFEIILNGFYSVDSFFLLSGFLVGYLFFQQCAKTKGKIPWLYFYIHRYIRLTPVYFIVLLFTAFVKPYLGSGPLWPATEDDPVCKANWWANILYINNFQQLDHQCMGWSWYLANDMQFYVVSPLFLVTLWRWPKIGYSLVGLFIGISFVINFVLTLQYDLIPGLANISAYATSFAGIVAKYTEYSVKIYPKPYARIGPYIIGIALAFYIFKRKQNNARKLNEVTLLIGWIVATGVTLTCMFGIYNQSATVLDTAFYNAFNRVLFACGLSWVIFVCVIGQGGVVNSILSWKVWIPLSRLTFCAYLVHPIVMTAYFTSFRRMIQLSNATVVMFYMGGLIMYYVAALLTTLLLESPIIRLERFVRNSFAS